MPMPGIYSLHSTTYDPETRNVVLREFADSCLEAKLNHQCVCVLRFFAEAERTVWTNKVPRGCASLNPQNRGGGVGVLCDSTSHSATRVFKWAPSASEGTRAVT
jgi:hypothetical protein